MSDWPSPAEALEQLRDAEYQAACRRHKKHSAVADAQWDASEKLFRAKAIAAEQDAQRKWGKRRA